MQGEKVRHAGWEEGRDEAETAGPPQEYLLASRTYRVLLFFP